MTKDQARIVSEKTLEAFSATHARGPEESAFSYHWRALQWMLLEPEGKAAFREAAAFVLGQA